MSIETAIATLDSRETHLSAETIRELVKDLVNIERYAFDPLPGYTDNSHHVKRVIVRGGRRMTYGLPASHDSMTAGLAVMLNMDVTTLRKEIQKQALQQLTWDEADYAALLAREAVHAKYASK